MYNIYIYDMQIILFGFGFNYLIFIRIMLVLMRPNIAMKISCHEN